MTKKENSRLNSSTRIYSGKTISLNLENVTLPNGRIVELEIVEHPGGAASAALDKEGNICLLRQFRRVANDWLWELPAGKIDQGENPLRTAKRELEEEAGVTARSWDSLGSIYSSPGVFAETIHLYLARDLTQATSHHDQDELIEINWLPFSTALSWAKTGKIVDAKSLLGIFRTQSHLS